MLNLLLSLFSAALVITPDALNLFKAHRLLKGNFFDGLIESSASKLPSEVFKEAIEIQTAESAWKNTPAQDHNKEWIVLAHEIGNQREEIQGCACQNSLESCHRWGAIEVVKFIELSLCHNTARAMTCEELIYIEANHSSNEGERDVVLFKVLELRVHMQVYVHAVFFYIFNPEIWSGVVCRTVEIKSHLN